MSFPNYPTFTPEKLFDAFCETFIAHKFLRDQQSLQPEMLRIFAEIGSRAGYEVSIEGFGDLDVMWRWNQPDSNFIHEASLGTRKPRWQKRQFLSTCFERGGKVATLPSRD